MLETLGQCLYDRGPIFGMMHHGPS